MRTRRVAASTRSSSASAPISPTSAKTMSPASSTSSHSASTTTASCCTGPPKDTVAPGSTRPASSGTASASSTSETRFNTRPTAPSSSCATTRRTVRRKFGSSSAGAATRSRPRNDSPILASRPRRGLAAPPPTLRRSREPTTIAVGFPRAKSNGLRATSSSAVDRDRHVVEQCLLDDGLLGLDPLQHKACAGRRVEQPRLDLRDRLQPDELLLERPREATAPEVPAVELLQEAGRAPVAELAHRLAEEQDELRDDLLLRRFGAVAFEDLLQGPWVPLCTAARPRGTCASRSRARAASSPRLGSRRPRPPPRRSRRRARRCRAASRLRRSSSPSAPGSRS